MTKSQRRMASRDRANGPDTRQRSVAGGDNPLGYHLIVSARAKRASLRVEPGRGVVVTVPKGFPRHRVAAFVEGNRQWLQDKLAVIERETPCHYRQWPPRILDFHATGQRILLNYSVNEASEQRATFADTVTSPGLVLHDWTISADPKDKASVVAELVQRLKVEAQIFLLPLVASYSHFHGFSYTTANVRGQKSRWGSCSSSGTLSLNYKLLFINRRLVDYVILHELAHTVHLNHSVAFWKLLCSLNVNARLLDRELKLAGWQVPAWLESCDFRY